MTTVGRETPDVPDVPCLDHEPIRCTIELWPDGVLVVDREPGCSASDAVQLCSLVAGGTEFHEVAPHENGAVPARATDPRMSWRSGFTRRADWWWTHVTVWRPDAEDGHTLGDRLARVLDARSADGSVARWRARGRGTSWEACFQARPCTEYTALFAEMSEPGRAVGWTLEVCAGERACSILGGPPRDALAKVGAWT